MLGIDLGATKVIGAIHFEGRLQIVPPGAFPACVAFTPTEVLVGAAAKAQVEHTSHCASVIRHMMCTERMQRPLAGSRTVHMQATADRANTFCGVKRLLGLNFTDAGVKEFLRANGLKVFPRIRSVGFRLRLRATLCRPSRRIRRSSTPKRRCSGGGRT